MTWRESLRKVSYRGVSFFVDDATVKGGRRGALHEYPHRDEPYFEDLGKKAREFTLRGYVLGAQYMAARDALEAALDEAGPATLVHPYRGEIQVVCTGWTTTESTREGGLASFDMTFAPAGENVFPMAVADTGALVGEKADAALLVVDEDFAQGFDVSGPAFIAEEAAAMLAEIAAAIDGATRGPLGLAASFVGKAAALKTQAESLVRTPSTLAGRVLSLVQDVGTLFTGGLSWQGSLRVFRSLASFGDSLPSVIGATPSRRAQAANQSALVALTRRASAVEAARSASTFTYASRQDAMGARDLVVDLLETEILTAGDLAQGDSIVRALADVRTATVKDLTARGASLVPLASHRPAATLPAFVIAHALYGDAGRADEIVARNKVRHPGFVPGGQDLEVLNG